MLSAALPEHSISTGHEGGIRDRKVELKCRTEDELGRTEGVGQGKCVCQHVPSRRFVEGLMYFNTFNIMYSRYAVSLVECLL